MELRIWNITHAQARKEEMLEEFMKGLPMRTEEPIFYWHVEQYVERKRRGKTVWMWVYLRDFHGTKARAADLWRRFYQGSTDPKYRLTLKSRMGQ